MRMQRWAIAAFVVVGTLYVTGLVADRPLPFGGALATACVLAIALVARTTGPARLLAPPAPRWARWAGVAGPAALTACAALVDARHGGNGWPLRAVSSGDPALTLEAGLLALAGALLAVSVLARIRRLIRPGHWPAAVAVVLLPFALVAVTLTLVGREMDRANEREFAKYADAHPRMRIDAATIHGGPTFDLAR